MSRVSTLGPYGKLAVAGLSILILFWSPCPYADINLVAGPRQADAYSERDLEKDEPKHLDAAIAFKRQMGEHNAADRLEALAKRGEIKASGDLPYSAVTTLSGGMVIRAGQFTHLGNPVALAALLDHELVHILQLEVGGPVLYKAALLGSEVSALFGQGHTVELEAWYSTIEAKLRWLKILRQEIDGQRPIWNEKVREFNRLVDEGCKDKQLVGEKAQELRKMAEELRQKAELGSKAAGEITGELSDGALHKYEVTRLADKILDPATGETLLARVQTWVPVLNQYTRTFEDASRRLERWIEWARTVPPDEPCPADLEPPGSMDGQPQPQPPDAVVYEIAEEASQQAQTAVATWVSADAFTRYELLAPLFYAAASYLRTTYHVEALTAGINFDIQLDQSCPFPSTRLTLGVRIEENALTHIEDAEGGMPSPSVVVELTETNIHGILSAPDPSAEFSALVSSGIIQVDIRVGGIVELSLDSSGSPARASEGGGAASFPFPAIAGTAAAAGALALVAGGWYARRRFSKG